MAQATATTTAQVRGYLQLLKVTHPVLVGRQLRPNGTRVLVHLVTDVNQGGRYLCGGMVGSVGEGPGPALEAPADQSRDPHHSQQCPRCWVELSRAAAHFEAQLPALEREVRRAAARRREEFASEAAAYEAIRQEAGGERIEGVQPPERHPLLAAASALGLPDCGPGCTCRGTTTQSREA